MRSEVRAQAEPPMRMCVVSVPSDPGEPPFMK